MFTHSQTDEWHSGSKINLTVHESSEAGGKVMDLRLRLEGAAINLRYGTEPDREKAGEARRPGAGQEGLGQGAGHRQRRRHR